MFTEEFTYEVWHDGRFVNAYAGLPVAIAKAEIIGPGSWVYEWVPSSHTRRPRYEVRST